MIEDHRPFFPNLQGHKVWELGLSLLVGILFGALVVISPNLPVSSDWQKLVLVIPFAFALVMVFKKLEKLILFTIAISVPLNLDFSVMISPYGITGENMANGRTIVALTGLRVSLIMIVVVIGYILWLVERQGASRRPIRFFASTSIPALGLIFFSIASVFQAQDVQLSFFKIAQLIELFLIYFYLANHLRTKQDLQFFVVVLMGAMLAESLLMIVQWRTGLSFDIAGIHASVSLKDLRTAGTLGTADTAGAIVAAYLMIVCVMIWLFPRRSQKVYAGVCFIIGCIALISTAGRAAWGGFIVAIVCFIFIGWRRGWVQLRSVVLLVLITLVIGGIFYPAIHNRLTEDDHGSAASRPLMFRLAWNVISASPSNFILGIGANNFALVAPAYNTVMGGNLGRQIQDTSVHNVYLLTWAETGLIGLVCLLSFLAAPLVNVWKHILSDDRFTSLLALGLGCGLGAMCIQMLVDPFIARPKSIFVWLIVSLVASISNTESIQISPSNTQQV